MAVHSGTLLPHELREPDADNGSLSEVSKDILKRTGANDIASAGEERVGATSNIRNDRTH